MVWRKFLSVLDLFVSTNFNFHYNFHTCLMRQLELILAIDFSISLKRLRSRTGSIILGKYREKLVKQHCRKELLDSFYLDVLYVQYMKTKMRKFQ